MKKLIALIFFSILLFSSILLPNLALAGSADIWLVCDSSIAGPGVDKTISGTNYYCCGTGNAYTAPYFWAGSECP